MKRRLLFARQRRELDVKLKLRSARPGALKPHVSPGFNTRAPDGRFSQYA